MVTLDRVTYSIMPDKHTETAYIDVFVDITFTEDDPRPENDFQEYHLHIYMMEKDSPDPDDYIDSWHFHIPYPDSVPYTIPFVKSVREAFYRLDKDSWPRGEDEIFFQVMFSRGMTKIAQGETSIFRYEFNPD